MSKPPKELAQDIAKRLTAMRLQRAWTRDDLAERAGINVYTLKHFERTGQISLERLIAVCAQLDILADLERAFKPRQRVNVENWAVPEGVVRLRKRGRRRQRPTVPETVPETETTEA